MQIALSSMQLKDVGNDIITSINGIATAWTAAQLVASLPETYYFENNTVGEQRLCVARIDGQPFVVTATNLGTPYPVNIDNYSILYPGNISTHPIHRPK